jgi:ABC-2 type transport system ATP-binding protein
VSVDPAGAPPPAIETRELSRGFSGRTAVDRLTLRVPEGAFYGFLGPNGAGKSTTIHMLTGLLVPDAGEARVLGMDVTREPLAVKRAIGVVPDGLHLFERLTGAEQLRFVGEVHGLPATVARERGRELLDAMGLTADADKQVIGWSHGMRKKLALSCALIHRPRVLFLDEPFEGIDAVSTAEIRELLQRIVRESRVTVFLTTHVLEVVERLCTHVGIIDAGRLAAEGSLDALRRGPDGTPRTLEELFLTTVGGGARPRAALDWLTGGSA